MYYFTVECPSLNDPDNGEIAVSSNGSISIATLSCKSGYSVIGEVTVTCTTDGQWSHTVPSCCKMINSSPFTELYFLSQPLILS